MAEGLPAGKLGIQAILFSSQPAFMEVIPTGPRRYIRMIRNTHTASLLIRAVSGKITPTVPQDSPSVPSANDLQESPKTILLNPPANSRIVVFIQERHIVGLQRMIEIP